MSGAIEARITDVISRVSSELSKDLFLPVGHFLCMKRRLSVEVPMLAWPGHNRLHALHMDDADMDLDQMDEATTQQDLHG